MYSFVCHFTLLLTLTFLTEGNALVAFTHLVDIGKKQYFISAYDSDLSGATIGCRFNGMNIAQLETQYEHDMLISTFDNSSLPTRAYVGISLKKNKDVIISETGQRISYRVSYHPENPNEYGVCLEILRQNGITAMNAISCRRRQKFICGKSADSSTSMLPSTTIPTTSTIPIAAQLHLKCSAEAEKCVCGNSDTQEGLDDTISATRLKPMKSVTDENAYNSTHMAVFDLITGTVTFKNKKTGEHVTKEARLDLVTKKIFLKTNETDNDLDHIETIRVVHRKIDSYTGHVIVEVIDLKDILFDRTTQQMWVHEGRHESTGNTIYTSTQADYETGVITTFYGFRNVTTNNIDIASFLESKNTRLNSSSMQILTNSGEVESDSSLPIYVINDIDVVSGEVYEKFAKLDRITGKLIFIKIRLLMRKDKRGLPVEWNYDSVNIDPVTRRVQRKMIVKTTIIYYSYPDEDYVINYNVHEEHKDKSELTTESNQTMKTDDSGTVYTREVILDGTWHFTEEQLRTIKNLTKIVNSTIT